MSNLLTWAIAGFPAKVAFGLGYSEKLKCDGWRDPSADLGLNSLQVRIGDANFSGFAAFHELCFFNRLTIRWLMLTAKQVRGQACEGLSGIERRTEPRHPIKQRCLVPSSGVTGEAWHCIVYNISTNGIGILLPLRPEPGTIIEIEPWQLPGAPILKARVVHTKLLEFVWMTGCELCTSLTDAELHAWLGAGIQKPGIEWDVTLDNAAVAK